MSRIYIGGDKKAHDLKEKLKKFLKDEMVDFVDLGLFNDDGSDYQDIVKEVSEKVAGDDTLGILIFGKQ